MHIYIYLYIYIDVCIFSRIGIIYVCRCITYIYIHSYECIYMCTYIGMNVYICVHIQAQVLFKKPYILSKEPHVLTKQTRILSKRPIFFPKAPYSFTRSSQYFFSKEFNYHLVLGLVCKAASSLQKSYMFSQKSPYPVTRAPHSLKRDPRFSIFSQKNSIVIQFLA